jgi:5-methyltetrahydropteroyltriglutamate--homocysteine methyltransferase
MKSETEETGGTNKTSRTAVSTPPALSSCRPAAIPRADNIGSLLRPPTLLAARERHQAGLLDDVTFKAIEDRAVDYCIAVQELSGIGVVTDGEMRRNVFASSLAQAVEGFDAVRGNTVDWFTLEGKKETSPVTVGLVSKLRRKRHLSSEEFVYLRARTRLPTKMTIPSPTMYAYYWVPGVSTAAYPTTDAYMADVTDILADEVRELVRLGCSYIQFDAPEFGMVLDPHQQEWFRRKGFDPLKMVHDGIEMMNTIMAGHHDRCTFGLHVCRGNDANRYMGKGSYGLIAEEILRRTDARVLLLEYDDERSGDFSPLALAGEDKIVCLGLVTTKRPREESEEELVTRVQEASKYVPLDRLTLSTQCGFASVAKGNNIPFELQERKLNLVTRVAARIWG